MLVLEEKMHKLVTPLEDVTQLKVGDVVQLSGTIFTARDTAHKYVIEEDFNKIRNAVIYHCGPIVKNNKIVSAGPTTSARLNIYTPKLIEKYGIKAIIGKGGMGKETLEALKGNAVYLSAFGGCGALYAECMNVIGCDKKEFGMPEAIWKLEVKDMPLIVTMDSKGNSLYEEIRAKSRL